MASDDNQMKFSLEPLGGKSIDDVPGMTDVYATNLRKHGVEKVMEYSVYHCPVVFYLHCLNTQTQSALGL